MLADCCWSTLRETDNKRYKRRSQLCHFFVGTYKNKYNKYESRFDEQARENDFFLEYPIFIGNI